MSVQILINAAQDHYGQSGTGGRARLGCGIILQQVIAEHLSQRLDVRLSQRRWYGYSHQQLLAYAGEEWVHKLKSIMQTEAGTVQAVAGYVFQVLIIQIEMNGVQQTLPNYVPIFTPWIQPYITSPEDRLLSVLALLSAGSHGSSRLVQQHKVVVVVVRGQGHSR